MILHCILKKTKMGSEVLLLFTKLYPHSYI